MAVDLGSSYLGGVYFLLYNSTSAGVANSHSYLDILSLTTADAQSTDGDLVFRDYVQVVKREDGPKVLCSGCEIPGVTGDLGVY